MSRDDLKQCSSIIKAMRRHPDAGPFLEPVDYKKLKLLDYPTIIKRPMDIDTIDKKLIVCDYNSVDEFFSDIKQIFDNCYLYNGKDAPVSVMASKLEAYFNKYKRDFSHATEILEQTTNPVTHQISRTKPKPKPKQPLRKGSHTNGNGLHKENTRISKSRMPAEHYEFCQNLIKEMFHKKHNAYSFPFLQPVDWEEMNIPDYPIIVKHPMDFSTAKTKLDTGKYNTVDEFGADIRLIFTNCYKYNPPSGQVYLMGKRLEQVFEKKWEARRGLSASINDGLSTDETTSEDDIVPIKTDRSQRQTKESTRPSKPVRKDPRPVKRKHINEPAANKIKNIVKSGKSKESGTKNNYEEYPPVTMEQMTELSAVINQLEGDQLTTVVDIISQSMPEIIGANKAIELDVNSLDNTTLARLYDEVVENPKRKQAKIAHNVDSRQSSTHVPASYKKTGKETSHKRDLSSTDESSGSDSDSSSGSSTSDSYGVSENRKSNRPILPSKITKPEKILNKNDTIAPKAKAFNQVKPVEKQRSDPPLQGKNKSPSDTQKKPATSVNPELKLYKDNNTSNVTPKLQPSTKEAADQERKERLERQLARDEEIAREVAKRKKQIEDEIKQRVEKDKEKRVELQIPPLDFLFQSREIIKFEERLSHEYFMAHKKIAANNIQTQHKDQPIIDNNHIITPTNSNLMNQNEAQNVEAHHPKPPEDNPPPPPIENKGFNHQSQALSPPLANPPSPPKENDLEEGELDE
ncbi:Bromodomain-containing protein [Neoconidiobolus thromboides FSU 785]|nr:Bromodomain-containing protein [Neoconidiobolus thromboides FSU 785]